MTTPHYSPDDPSGSPGDASWPANLDALHAASDHHTLLFENHAVRVLDTRIRPGDQTPLHTHRWPCVLYIISWSSFLRRDAAGTVVLDSRTVPQLADPPPVLWSAPLPPHTLENIGASDLHVLSVELKLAQNFSPSASG